MKPILVIDCGSSKVPDIVMQVKQNGHPVNRIALADIKPEDFEENAGIIISGAPILITKEDPAPHAALLRPLLFVNVPILGICFGHQMLGVLHNALPSICMEAREVQDVLLVETDPLFEGISSPASFRQDHIEAIELPEGFIHLASSRICMNEAMKHPRKSMWGVQFHPECDTEDGVTLLRNFCAFCQ